MVDARQVTPQPNDDDKPGDAEATGSSGAPDATERYRDATSEAQEHAAAEDARRERDHAAAERVEEREEADRIRPQLDPITARELVLAEAALAILEDEPMLEMDDEQLARYEPAEVDRGVADLIGARPEDRGGASDRAAIEAAAARAMSLIIGLQKQLDFEFDYAAAGDAVPTRAMALRGAIARAIARVGGLAGPPVVGSFVIALRKSRSVVAEPMIDVWLSHAEDDRRIAALLPPEGSPGRRAAVESLVVLEAAGAVGGRSNMNDVLAVERALAALDDARREAGLEPVRLPDLARIDAATTRGAERGGVEFERDLELRRSSP